jgi:hypothetical protein
MKGHAMSHLFALSVSSFFLSFGEGAVGTYVHKIVIISKLFHYFSTVYFKKKAQAKNRHFN